MNSSTGKQLVSVVVPVYNSTETLGTLLQGIQSAVSTAHLDLEVIFVDDHGSAESWETLEQIKSTHSYVKIIRLSKNFGQNSATLCGIDHAAGDLVVTIDDDLETDPMEITQMIEMAEAKQSDVVYGIFKKTSTRFLRNLGRRFLLFLLNKAENGTAIGSSFRLIRRNIVEKINHHNQDHLFINQIISWYTSDIDYVQVEHSPRKNNKSGYSLRKLFGIGLKLLF